MTHRRGRDEKPIIEARGVGRAFRGPDGEMFVALRDVDLEIDRGRFVCLVGPSGCGKSTLLNMIAGLLTPTTGGLMYDGEPIQAVNTRAGYITQNDTLLPWATIERNVGLGLRIRGIGTRRERLGLVRDALGRVGLAAFAGHYPAQLSGGMRKRAILARSLLYNPDTLLMDEPFGALDAQMRMALQAHLLDIWEQNRKTVVFVTHDLEEALLLADEVIVFGTDPGRVIHRELVDIPRPRDIFTLRTTPEFADLWRQLWDMIAAFSPDLGSVQREGGT